MFEPLRITEQFLLKTNMREVLFRKPAAAAAVEAAGPAAPAAAATPGKTGAPAGAPAQR